ncbi:MAG: polyphosphate kinase 2 family protein [Acidobacteria bacterium]|nr:polyphosphate kinase 2 family protein [Acidobacteriota bacterium]
MKLTIKVKPGTTVKLDKHDPDETFGLTEEQADERLAMLTDELGELQELLYAARQHSVLIILQGMDTSGKDGTVKKVMTDVNPLGCRVEAFKVPSEEELAHDFLWRVHKVVPPKGLMTIFNRSHYEDVLVVRVHELVAKRVWKSRFHQINEFERTLVESGTIIVKFFLHISKHEQQKRLQAREREAAKAWKLSPGDWQERELWEAYQSAYETALMRCSTAYAKWHIVPANQKWFRNLAVAEALVRTLRPYRKDWEKVLQKLSDRKLAELEAMRATRSADA